MRIRKWLSIIVVVFLLVSGLPMTSLAETSTDSGKYTVKDEVIYANLYADGQTKNMYVVNSFDVTKPGEIIDYGKYVNVRNLTDLTTIERKNHDEIHFQASEGKFFYQGELENEPLPWDISVSYVLDGEEISPDELIGKSGQVEIQIETKANKHVDPLFVEHFLLQVSLTLDPEIFHDIQAPKGTEANEGKNKQMTFTVLPDQDEVLIVSALVDAFEMEPIDIAAIPANIAIEDPDFSEMTGGMGTLAQAIQDLHEGVASLNEGAGELSDGASSLKQGSASYRKGINELDQSSGSLVGGSKEIRNALRQINQAMQESPEIDLSDLEKLQEIPEALRDAAKELTNFSPVLKELIKEMNDLDIEVDEEQLSELYELIKASDLDDEIVEQLEKSYEIAQRIKEIGKDIPVDALDMIGNIADPMYALADEIEAGLKELDQLEDLAELQTGFMTLTSEYEQFHDGLTDYTSGVHALATSYGEIDTGIAGLSDGTASLSSGIADLYEGTTELRDETSKLPEEIESKIAEFMEAYDFASFEPASFVSDQNQHPGVVQFVLQTEPLKIDEPEEDDQEEKEEKSLWTRFLDLFR